MLYYTNYDIPTQTLYIIAKTCAAHAIKLSLKQTFFEQSHPPQKEK